MLTQIAVEGTLCKRELTHVGCAAQLLGVHWPSAVTKVEECRRELREYKLTLVVSFCRLQRRYFLRSNWRNVTWCVGNVIDMK